MTSYLIDTNIVSELARPEPNSKVRLWFERADPDYLYASVVSVGEIRLGIENLPEGKRRSALESWVRFGLPGWFEPNLLPVTKEIADLWGRLSIVARRAGVTLSTPDGMIAATAITHGLTLVTRNVKDFARLNVTLLNPWRPEASSVFTEET